MRDIGSAWLDSSWLSVYMSCRILFHGMVQCLGSQCQCLVLLCLLYVKRIKIVIMFCRWMFGDALRTDVAKSSSGCSVTDAVFALCWYLTVVSGTVCTHEQIILFTCHVLRSSECITSRNESPGRGHSEISFIIISWNHMPTPQTATL